MSETADARFERYKQILVGIIRKKLPSCKIYLFGSRARKEHQSGSDIDLALDNGAPIGMRTILALYNEIDETTIPLTVDLVDLYTASEPLKIEVYREGVLWIS